MNSTTASAYANEGDAAIYGRARAERDALLACREELRWMLAQAAKDGWFPARAWLMLKRADALAAGQGVR